MININGISKSYGEKTVFSELTFSLEENICTALLGGSGIGKTTLMRCISGLEPPDRGSVTGFEGRKRSFVFQENRLIEGASALENITCLVPDRDRALYYLDRAGIADAAGKRTAELSGGMKRRLAVARALACGGDVYFLDEPLRELDGENELRMLELIKEEIKGKTALLITHERAHSDFLAERSLSFAGSPMRLTE